MKIECPTCSKSVEWSETSPFRPFCSDRCRLIDLGAWADEQYAIPTQDAPDTFDLPGESEYSS